MARTTLAAAVMVATLAGTVSTAEAVVPGRNGRIAFGGDRTGNVEIYSVRSDGSDLVQLTHNGAFNACASWSPDGRKIAFCSSLGGSFDIWIMDADGAHPHELHTGVGFAIFPSWSPDGRRLSFVGKATPGDPGDIYVMNVDGTHVRDVTNSAADDGTQGANWSPTGRTIVYDSNAGGKYDVYTMKPDGTGVVRVTSGSGDNTMPDWNPTGSTIAFVHGGIDSAGNPIGDVWTVGPDGTRLRRITANPDGDDANPAYSPDGAFIVFRRDDASGNSAIYRVRMSTKQVHLVSGGTWRHLAPDWQARG